MTDPTNPAGGPDRDDDMLAAEYALGLLEGEELLTARGQAAHDPAFSASVARWNAHLAPLLDEVQPIECSRDLWPEIAAQISRREELAAQPDPDNVVVLDLQQQLQRWKVTAGLSSAAAVAALAFLVFGLSQSPPPQDANRDAPVQMVSAAPLVASIPIGETQLRLGITFLPDSDEMLVSASGLSADGVHDHELWLVPRDGSALQSLGVVVPGEERRVELPADVTRNMGDGVELLLTREPLGGKPEGQDAGPVVAQGALAQV
ncbi:MAG: anti-sigma factor [Pseudomonadota bacterium]